ncbi:MAG: peptidoglycan DD-metalloendopeptidase family protein [Woeseiaceae bacterium]|nr:peptidoglycan DD-metalloendopeptidase family protein [Woeseiaceae bacterium]
MLLVSACGGSSGAQSSPSGGSPPPSGDSQAPVLSIDYPEDGVSLPFRTLEITVTIDDPTASIEVNGVSIVNTGDRIIHELVLNPGSNLIVVNASDAAGNSTSESVSVIWDVVGAVIIDNSVSQSVGVAGARLELPTVAAVEIGPNTADFGVTVSAVRMSAIDESLARTELSLHGSQPALRIYADDFFSDTVGIVFDIPDLEALTLSDLGVDLAVFQLVGSDEEGLQTGLSTVGAIPCRDRTAICARVSPGSFMDLDPFAESGTDQRTLVVVPVTFDATPEPDPVTSPTMQHKLAAMAPQWRIWEDIGPVDDVSGMPGISIPVDQSAETLGQVDVSFEFTLNPNITLEANPLAIMTERSPYGRRNNRRLGLHEGVDYSAMTGTAVRAMHSGTAGNYGSLTGSCGLLKQIGIGLDWWTRYCHLSDQLMGHGAQVNVSDVIAMSGDTGINAEGKKYAAHLHVDLPLLVDGGFLDGRIDPRPFLPGNSPVDILAPWSNVEPQDLPARIELLLDGKRVGNAYQLEVVGDQGISIQVPLAEVPGWDTAPDGVELTAILMAPRLALNQRQFQLGKVRIADEPPPAPTLTGTTGSSRGNRIVSQSGGQCGLGGFVYDNDPLVGSVSVLGECSTPYEQSSLTTAQHSIVTGENGATVTVSATSASSSGSGYIALWAKGVGGGGVDYSIEEAMCFRISGDATAGLESYWGRSKVIVNLFDSDNLQFSYLLQANGETGPQSESIYSEGTVQAGFVSLSVEATAESLVQPNPGSSGTANANVTLELLPTCDAVGGQ